MLNPICKHNTTCVCVCVRALMPHVAIQDMGFASSVAGTACKGKIVELNLFNITYTIGSRLPASRIPTHCCTTNVLVFLDSLYITLSMRSRGCVGQGTVRDLYTAHGSPTLQTHKIGH